MSETFVTCQPTHLDNGTPNNVFMSRGKGNHRITAKERDKACAIYHDYYKMLQVCGVEVLEIPVKVGAQDQPYTANIGIWMTPETGANGPHLIVANFKAAGREIEEEPAMRFFHELGLSPKKCPADWEGEADLKYLRPGLYAGGYGKFSDKPAYKWISKLTGVDIILMEEISDQLYHLDCSIMRVNDDNVLVTPEGLSGASIDLLKKYYDEDKGQKIHFTPPKFWQAGFTNSVLIESAGVVIHEDYEPDWMHKEFKTAQEVLDVIKKSEAMEEWTENFWDSMGLVEHTIKIGPYELSGADWSCTHMHLSGWRKYSTRHCEEHSWKH